MLREIAAGPVEPEIPALDLRWQVRAGNEDRRNVEIINDFRPGVERFEFDAVARTPPKHAARLQDAAILARKILLIFVREPGGDAQSVANDREVPVEVERDGIIGAEIENRAEDRVVARVPQRVIGDAGRCGERVALRGQAHPDGRTADEAAGEASVVSYGEPLDADVARGRRAEAPDVARAVEADLLIADAGAERVVGGFDGVLVGTLRKGRRGGGEQKGGNADEP
ncbi:MAG: hypothetical protein ACM3ZV_06575 [Bacillota bacterium]